LLLTGCNRGDTKLRQQIAGTWITSDSNGIIKINSDGSFVTKWTIANTNTIYKLIYEGTWQIKDGIMISTISKADGYERHEVVGTVDRYKIIRLNDRELFYEFGTNQTIMLNRKR
jgi:hypothetical protein